MVTNPHRCHITVQCPAGGHHHRAASQSNHLALDRRCLRCGLSEDIWTEHTTNSHRKDQTS